MVLFFLRSVCFVVFVLQLSDGLNAIPMTEKEKRDCSSVLSPQQLKLVDIGRNLRAVPVTVKSLTCGRE